MSIAAVRRIRAALTALVAGAVLTVGSGATAADPSPAPADAALAEVRAFVDRAAAFVASDGTEAALAAFSDPSGPFQDGELYIYAYRMDGTVIAHGGNPALIGQNLIATVDADGVPVIAGLVRLAATGGGWLAYRWPNPATGEEAARKIGYVVPIDTTWFLGSGAYGAAALPPTEAAARTLLAQALEAARSLPRAEALARFADPAGPFTVGQLRVVAVDADGLLLADPYAPALVGRPALPGLGLDGAAGRDAFLAAAADPAGGSIDVLAGDPTTGGRLGPRRLLVADVDGAWTLVVGFPAPDPAG